MGNNIESEHEDDVKRRLARLEAMAQRVEIQQQIDELKAKEKDRKYDWPPID